MAVSVSVSSVFPDVVHPEVLAVSLSFPASFRLVAHVSEVIDALTLNATGVRFVSTNTSFASMAEDVTAFSINDTTITVQFTVQFTDLLKRQAVCLTAQDCAVSFALTFVRDYAGLDLVAVDMPVSVVEPDTTRVAFIQFELLDYN